MKDTRSPAAAWRGAAARSAPILEHDPAREAVLEPAQAVPRKNVVPSGLAEGCVRAATSKYG